MTDEWEWPERSPGRPVTPIRNDDDDNRIKAEQLEFALSQIVSPVLRMIIDCLDELIDAVNDPVTKGAFRQLGTESKNLLADLQGVLEEERQGR